MPLLGAKGQHICCSNAATRQFTCAGTWSAKFDLSNWNDKFWYNFALFKVEVFSLPEYNAYLRISCEGICCILHRAKLSCVLGDGCGAGQDVSMQVCKYKEINKQTNFLVLWEMDAVQSKMCSVQFHTCTGRRTIQLKIDKIKDEYTC